MNQSIVNILNLAAGTILPDYCSTYITKIDISNNLKVVNVDRIYDNKIPYSEIIEQLSKNGNVNIYHKDDLWNFLNNFYNTFDLILCHRILEHIPLLDVLTFIYLMRTKCSKNGYCDVIVPDWNLLKQIDIDKDDQILTKDYLTLVYELCNYPKDPHACVFTEKKLIEFFELEGAWKHVDTFSNYKYDNRDIYLRCIFQAI